MDNTLRLLQRAAISGDSEAQKKYTATLERAIGLPPAERFKAAELVDVYFEVQKQLHDYFGYEEDWVTIPLDDQRDQYWLLTAGGVGGKYCHSPDPLTAENIEAGTHIYGGLIYTQRFLDKWVYRGKDYTMVAADTQTDGNKFLMIFDNKKEVKDPDLIELYYESWGSI